MPGCRTWQEVAGAGAGLLLNRDSPLTSGMILCARAIQDGGVKMLDVVSRKNFTNPVAASVVLEDGIAVRAAGRTSNALYNSSLAMPTDAITMAACIRVVAFNTGAPSDFFSKRNYWSSSDGAGIWCGYINNTDVSFSVNSTQALSATNMIAVGGYYHLVGTYDGATVTIYRNGVSVATASTTGAITGNAENWRVSGWPNGVDPTYDVASLAVWSRALTKAEVWGMYAPSTRHDLYWRKSRSAPKQSAAAAATTFGFLRSNAGVGNIGGGPFSRSNAGLGVLS